MSSSTHYQLIVDASGSMSGSETATVGSMNEQIALVRRLATEYPNEQFSLGIVDFSTDIRVLREMAPIHTVREVARNEYITRDSTALYDAVGTTVTRLDNIREAKNHNDRDSYVIVVITDGHENASQHYNFTAIKSLLSQLEQTGKWQFRFIGADFLTDDFTQRLGLQHAKSYSVSKSRMDDVESYMSNEMAKIMTEKHGNR
jgi:Mg-chelatase subunit ChlD